MNEPIRTCVGCRLRAPQRELLRYVWVDGLMVADRNLTAGGRGSWLHPEQSCLELAHKRGGFARSQRRPADARGLVAPLSGSRPLS